MRINKFIDHTILKPESTKEEVIIVCKEAVKFNFASVCVNPYYTNLVAKELKGSSIGTCTVIGFPLGVTTTECKVNEAKNAIKNGASEIDMVLNIGALKSSDLRYVEQDIAKVVEVTKENVLVKVILETCLLSDKEIILACQIGKKSGANFVKTSTGFNREGAKLKDVSLMRETVGQSMGVKASGGIRSYEKAVEMIKAGANRIGASSSVKIIQEQNKILNSKSKGENRE